VICFEQIRMKVIGSVDSIFLTQHAVASLPFVEVQLHAAALPFASVQFVPAALPL
jgi:hypothetical protein